MAPWKLPLIVAAIVVPVTAAFMLGGPGVGVAIGALAGVALVVIAALERPRGTIDSVPADDGRRHVLIVATGPVEDPGEVARIIRATGIESPDREPEVRVLVPARIGFLDRWASDVESARHRAQQSLVATVAALAKAGIAAEARVGDEDVVQATEDQLQGFPATDVVLVSRDPAHDDDGAAEELGSRLRADFRHVQLGD